MLDFVPKPVGAPCLALAPQRMSRAATAHSGGRAVRHLAVWRARGVALVAVDELSCIRAVPEGTEVHLCAGGTELHAKPLERLLPLLPASFVRCHRSWIVHLDAVRAVHSARGSRNWPTLHDGVEVPVGRMWLETLRKRLA